jgi:hypothetical protein
MRLYQLVRFGILLLGATVPLLAHGQFQTPSKEELSMTSDPKAPGASAVFLYREEREDDPHHFRSVYARIKVLTEAGKELATVHVVYRKRFVFSASGNNSSRMGSGTSNHWEIPDMNHAGEDRPWDPYSFVGHVEVAAIEGRTIHPDGSIVPLTGNPADLLKTRVGSDQYNEMVFTLPSVEVGSILEYRYQVRYDRFQQPPDWQVQQSYFVHHAHYVFIPTERFSNDRTKGGPGVSDSTLLAPNGEILTDVRAAAILPNGKSLQANALGEYVLDLTDIPPIPNEAYAPPLASQIYQVNFYYTYTPDEKEFWQKEMSWWTRDVNRYIAHTPLLKQTVAETCAASDSPLDKAGKLYALVQRLENVDMDRTSTSGLIPSGSVEAVLENKKGTGEELTLLYLALARAAGLNARPERIANRLNRMFAHSFLSTDQLDAIVIGLDIDGKHITVDPGFKMAPFQTLFWGHAGAGGVAMGSNGKVEFVLTPLADGIENTTIRVGSLNVTPQGAVSGTLKVGFTGQQAIQLRQLALRSGAEAVNHQINGMLAGDVPAGIDAHVDRVANLEDYTKQLVAIVPVSGTLASTAGSHLILPRIFFETRESNPFPEMGNRTLPVNLPYPGQEQEQITYVFPPGYVLEGKPEDTVFKWEENAAYQLKSMANGTSITTARILARGFTWLEASQYRPLREFYEKVLVADHQQIGLAAAQSRGEQVPESAH